MTSALCVTVLAAGKGTRMRNPLAKVLHPLAGRSLIEHVLANVAELSPERTVLVLADGMEEVAAVARRAPDTPTIVIQEPQLGTGHALQAALPALPTVGTVLVVYGDTPLLAASTLARLVAAREVAGAAVAVLGMRPSEPEGYGRLQVEEGRLVAIVEERDADPVLRREAACNSGVMAFDATRLAELLAGLTLHQDKGEYYLTDTVALAVARGWACVAIEGPAEEGLGVNSQQQLASARELLQRRLRARLMDQGAILHAPDTLQLCVDAEVAPGAVIEPYVIMGPGVRIGAGAVIRGFSHLEGATVGEGAEIGPFARLRRGTVVEAGARVGNFVETKNTRLEAGAKANHLSYLGDTVVGAAANVGAGTISCNYDGFTKSATRIGAGAFIGSNTALVAPVTVGERAIVAAGSTVTADVPADGFAVARARQTTREHGAERVRERLRARKSG